jgi:ParB family chromosome partitioning protein
MATLVYSDVDGTDRSFSLGADPILVGRSAECAIRSDDPRVSRQHARFFLEHGALWVEDLGSSNGIYVGPQKVQRAPVPTGEIVLVGSLMIRLLPASGTLPPPIGLHGTLAQWLEMERKARSVIEDERNAFVERVGQLFEEMKALRDAGAAHEAEANELRAELEKIQRQSSADMEHARLDLAKAREAKIVAETQAGITTAEKLAESDMMISQLQHEVANLRAAASTARDESPAKLLSDQVAAVTLRAEKAEKELGTAQIRAQGAERNLSAANTNAAKAETRAAELEHKLADLGTTRGALDAELAAAREQISQLEARVAAGPVSHKLDAAEARAARLAGELVEMTQQFEARRDRISELERDLADAGEAKGASSEAEKKIQATLAEAQAKARSELAAAQTRIGELEARLRTAASAEAEIAAAKKAREDAAAATNAAEKKLGEATTRADGAEARASAADTMAKAMAKDVAEALRRAVDADTKARAVSRELAGAHRKADEAEQRAAAVAETEARAKAAEQQLVELQARVQDQLAELEKDLTAKSDKLILELRDKLGATQRELAAERQSSMAIIDRKTQLERELTELRTSSTGSGTRASEAEAKLAEYEVQIEQLEDRIQDLESGIAVEQTASRSTVDESKTRISKLEEQLGEAKAAAKTALKTAAGLEKRVDATETQLAAAQAAKAAAEAAVAEAKQQLEAIAAEGDLKALAAQAEQRALAAEAQLEPLAAKADAADLAIGRASALQRQLDEALQKLSWAEREQDTRGGDDDDDKVSKLIQQLDAAENRARAAELLAREADQHAREYADRMREGARRTNELEQAERAAEAKLQEAMDQAARLQAHADDLEGQTNDAQAQARELESSLRASEQRAAEVDARARDIEQRAKDAAERIVEAERRARDTQNQLAEMTQMLHAAEAQVAEARTVSAGGNAGLERQLAAAQQRIGELKREVDAAENVRQFAANTEREIAQLERELREHKAKVTQITLERDRLESQLRDLRDDSETTHRKVPALDEAPSQHARYTQLVSRASELEQKNGKLEKDLVALRRQLSETEARAEAQARAHEDEPTNTGNALPLEFAEHLNVLEESIDSLRANMRAASDETAMMDQTESVVAVASAVSQAAEHVERARDSLRLLAGLVAKS